MNPHSSRSLLSLAVCLGALAACGENHEILGSRPAAGGAGGASGGSTAGHAPGSGGLGMGSGGGSAATPGAAGSAGFAGSGTTAGAGTTGGAGRGGGAPGSGGSIGGSAPNAGQSAGGLTDQGGAGSGNAGASGTSGDAGGAGAPASCSNGCTTTLPVTCPDGEVGWTCTSEYDPQSFVNSGCTDLATDIQRFCCPAAFFTGCKPCADVSTLDECETRIDCHSVFVDPGTCGCATPGCCAHFSRCADGAWAVCSDATVNCDLATPHCESTYVVSYANGCYEGCVASKDCPVQ